MYWIYCHELEVRDYGRVLDWMAGFDTLHTLLRITINYSAIAHLHILQVTVTHVQVFSAFTSILVTNW
jgi:hypothetical protein